MRDLSIIAQFVKRPVTILMVVLAIFVVGGLAFLRIPVRLLPEGAQNQTVTVFTPLENVNPEEVEDKITRPLEESLRTISGVTEISSRSSEGSSAIRVDFSGSIDMALAKAEVRDRVERTRPSLPEEVNKVFVWSFSMDDAAPIMFLGLMFDERDMQTQDVIDQIIDPRLTATDGVARVQIWGGAERTVRILFDEEKVRSLRIRLFDIIQKLSRDNFARPAGKLREADTEYFIRVDARFQDLETIRQIPIREDLRLGDVARVVFATSERDTRSRINGKDSYFCAVSKTSDANTVDVCKRVEATLEELRTKENLRGFDALVIFSQGRMIEGSIETLSRTAMMGAVTAIIVLWAFLRRLRMTLLVTACIPVSLLVTLIAVYFMGGSFNILTMMGITLAVGMLVDNAVVVVENIHRLREKGVPPMSAAIQGAREVGMAVAMATLTTVAVFAPLMFMSEGMLKLIFSGLGEPVCISLLASLAVALLILPTSVPRVGESRRKKLPKPGRVIPLLSRINVGWLNLMLSHRVVACALAGAVAFSIYPAGKLVTKALNQGDDGGTSIRVGLEFGSNFTIEDADRATTRYEETLAAHKQELGFENMSVRVSVTGGQLGVFYPEPIKEEEEKRIIDRLKEILPELAGVEVRYPSSDNEFSSGSAEGRDRIGLVLRGPDSKKVRALGEEIARRFEEHPGMHSVETSLARGRDEMSVQLDRGAMARSGVDANTVSGVIRWGLSGFPVSQFDDHGIDLRIIMQYDRTAQESVNQLEDLPVFSSSGKMVPVGSIAKLQPQRSLGSISRRDGRASFSVSARTGDGKDLQKAWGKVAEALEGKYTEEAKPLELPRGYEFEEAGGLAEWSENMKTMVRAGWLALALVYVIMGILFENFFLPISILFTIPFAIAGALWALYVTNQPLDMVAMIGMVVLVGVVVNNGVVLIDHINRLRKIDGFDRAQAIRRASQERLRPILMTSLTTMAGLLPAALESTPPGGGISYQTLSVAVIGGLATATLFTLWVVPLLYTLIEDFTSTVWRAILRFVHRQGSRDETADVQLETSPIVGVVEPDVMA
ncbi:MAG: efflux RND transporter permease subunit [Planctomycetes bacterium]|nr:efflux RND transporter permease subunit [Planctomycetota bacterium]